MKAAETSEVKLEQQLFTECWNFLKKYYRINQDSESDFDIMVKESKEIRLKYKGTKVEKLSLEMITSTMMFLDGVSKSRDTSRSC